MKTALLISASLASLVGCSVAARSPNDYRDQTQAILETKNNDIRACYDEVLKGSPTAAGKVTVTFTVPSSGDPGEGTVTDVQIDKANTTAPDAVADCVAKSITGVGTLNPPDQRTGKASFAYEFTAPPAAAAAAPNG